MSTRIGLRIGLAWFLKKIPIRIHIWGGFGSQLFGCLAARRAQNQFPDRLIHLYFHTSGVSRRELEMPQSILQGFSFSIVDDYKHTDLGTQDSISMNKSMIRLFVAQLIQALGLLSRPNSESDFKKIKRFVLEIRGHYSNLELQHEEVSWIFTSLQLTPFPTGLENRISLHYRLGDLLRIKEKNPITIDRILTELNKFDYINELCLYSDSPDSEALLEIKKRVVPMRTTVKHLNTLDVIFDSLNSKVFVGTNSKISNWIAIFRVFSNSEGTTLIPKEASRQLATSLKLAGGIQNLIMY